MLLARATIDDEVRKAIVDAVADVSFEGVTGKVAFDEFGDTTTKMLTVYKVEGGKWARSRPTSSRRLVLASLDDGWAVRLGASGPPRPCAPRRRPGRCVAQFLQQLVNGLVLGATYGLIALGYTMVYGIIQLINFAHGEIFMVGAFAGLATCLVRAAGQPASNPSWCSCP